MNDEVFIAMAKALDFIDPDKLSMTVILTAMNRFINETSGSRVAFLDGNQPARLCAPLKAHVEARGGSVRAGAPLRRIELNADGTVAGLRLAGRDGAEGELVVADAYVSAMSVDALKLLLPDPWRALPFFAQLDVRPLVTFFPWFSLRDVSAPHLADTHGNPRISADSLPRIPRGRSSRGSPSSTYTCGSTGS